MPTFDTPHPLSVKVDVGLGDISLVASDRTDTTVDVRPSSPTRALDVKDAEQTVVELTDGVLVVKAPRRFSLFGRGGSVDVALAVPTGTEVDLTGAISEIRVTGQLSRARIKLGMGNIRLDRTGPLHVSTGMGDITVDHVAGATEAHTGSGAVRIGHSDGSAVIKNSNGDTWLGTVGGDVRVNAANGDITVEHTEGSVRAKSANGHIRLQDVVRGSVDVQTAAGTLDIGIRRGTAAWLDVSTGVGRVSTDLSAAEDPGPAGETVEVRGRTSFGDITVHRS